MRSDPYTIRLLQPQDQGGVRALAEATAWLGRPSEGHVPHPALWADFWTGYFLSEEPEHSWVAQGPEGEVQAFLTGTFDVRRFERHAKRHAPALLAQLLIRGTLIRRSGRGAARSLLRSFLGGELVLPEKVRSAYPATFQLAVAESAREHGLGAQLLEHWLQALVAAKVSGVHAQTMSLDEPRTALYRRAGFQLVARWPLTAFAHKVQLPNELFTWALPL